MLQTLFNCLTDTLQSTHGNTSTYGYVAGVSLSILMHILDITFVGCTGTKVLVLAIVGFLSVCTDYQTRMDSAYNSVMTPTNYEKPSAR